MEWSRWRKTFMAKNPGSVGLAFNFAEPFWLVPWLGGYNGKVFADDGKTPSLNTDAMVKALTLVSNFKNVRPRLRRRNATMPAPTACSKTAKAAMIINGDWSLGDYNGSTAAVTATKNIDLGTARIRRLPVRTSPSRSPRAYISCSRRTWQADKQAAALKLTNYFLSDAVQLRWLKEQKRLPSIQKLFDDPSIKSDPILAGFSS